MWRHNYVTRHNEYLIITLSESIPPVHNIRCDFLHKSTHYSAIHIRKWVFFLNTQHSVVTPAVDTDLAASTRRARDDDDCRVTGRFLDVTRQTDMSLSAVSCLAANLRTQTQPHHWDSSTNGAVADRLVSDNSVLLVWAVTLTLWCPLLPYGYSYKASCARPS